MKWIKIKEKHPTESDGLIIVSLTNRFKEIVYVEKGIFKKPFAYDKYDTPIAIIDKVKYWFKLTEPIELTKNPLLRWKGKWPGDESFEELINN